MNLNYNKLSPQMEQLLDLHDSILFYSLIILLGVSWIIFSVICTYLSNNFSTSIWYLRGVELLKSLSEIAFWSINLLVAYCIASLTGDIGDIPCSSWTIHVEDGYWYYHSNYDYVSYLDSDGDNESEQIHFDSLANYMDTNRPVNPQPTGNTGNTVGNNVVPAGNGGNNPGGNVPGNNPGGNVPGNNAFPTVQEAAIRDHVLTNGYDVNVSNQPYARNLAKVMDDSYKLHRDNQSIDNIGVNDQAYVFKLLSVYHPDYDFNRHYPNTAGYRTFLRRLP